MKMSFSYEGESRETVNLLDSMIKWIASVFPAASYRVKRADIIKNISLH